MKKKAGYISRIGKEKKVKICLGVLGVLVLLAILVPILSPYPYDMQEVNSQNLGMSAEHWFGTDKFGRDIFTRVCYGLRISLAVGFGSTAVCVLIAMFIGSLAGLCGPLLDSILLEIMNVISAIPSMLYVILTLLVFEASVKSVMIGICVSGWIDLAKMLRVETRRIGQMDYCIAAKTMGFSRLRIIWKYILPNEKELLIVQTILLIPKAIFTEAFLSFLGIGIAAPRASLGTLIQDAKTMITQYPTQMLYPILVLAVLVVCLQSLGYALERKA